MRGIVEVAVNVPLLRLFHYEVPEGLSSRIELGHSATWAVPVFLPDGILVRDQTSVQKLA